MPDPTPSVTEHATEAVHALLTAIVDQAKSKYYDAETIEHFANPCESLSRTALRWREATNDVIGG